MPEPKDNSAVAEPKQQGSIDPAATAGDGTPAADDKSTAAVDERFQSESGDIDSQKLYTSYKELEKERGRLGNEVGDLRKQVEQNEVNTAMLEAIKNLGQNADTGTEQESLPEYIARKTESGDWDEPGAMARDLAHLNNTWIEQATGEQKKELELLRDKYATLEATVEKKTNPLYVQHQDRINQLQSYDPQMSDEVALKIATEETATDDTPAPPASVPGARHTDTGPSAKSEYWTAEDRAAFVASKTEEARGGGNTPEVAAQMANMLADNMETADAQRKARLAQKEEE